jgi:hypothetical protein
VLCCVPGVGLCDCIFLFKLCVFYNVDIILPLCVLLILVVSYVFHDVIENTGCIVLSGC